MASLFTAPQFDGGTGITPEDGLQLFFFEEGTSAPKNTFTDEALTIAHAHPVVSLANGVFEEIWMADSDRYTIDLKNKNDVLAGFGAVSLYIAGVTTGEGIAALTESIYTATPDNVVALRLLSPAAGDTANTKGYNSSNDGNNADYLAVTIGSANNLVNHDSATAGVKWILQNQTVTFGQAGAVGDGLVNDTDSILAAVTARGFATGDQGKTYLVTKAAIDYGTVGGQGLFKIGTNTFPVGNIESTTTINIPEAFDYKDIFNDYLPSRRVLAELTVSVTASASVDMTTGPNIRYEHIDGSLISIIGTSAASIKLTFDFTGRGGDRIYALGLDGNYSIKLVNGITFDGDNFSGHSDGGPTLGDGLATDPIGLKAQNNAAIECGTDVVFQFFARNGVLANEGAYILANSVDVNNCGSDAFVSSIGSKVFAQDSTCSIIYGDAYFADRGGDLYCKGLVADDIRARFSGSAGDGLVAAECGKIYAEDATITNIADIGALSISGGAIIGDDITIGGSGVGCGGDGVLIEGGYFSGSRLSTTFNGGKGLNVQNSARVNAPGVVASSNTNDGVSVTESSTATISGGTCDSNGSDGINCENSHVHATSMVSIDNNTLFGIISRRSGIVNADGTTIGGSNGSGTASPAANTTSGIADSFIYT